MSVSSLRIHLWLLLWYKRPNAAVYSSRLHFHNVRATVFYWLDNKRPQQQLRSCHREKSVSNRLNCGVFVRFTDLIKMLFPVNCLLEQHKFINILLCEINWTIVSGPFSPTFECLRFTVWNDVYAGLFSHSLLKVLLKFSLSSVKI